MQPEPGGGDRLAVHVVLHVAGGEHAFDRRLASSRARSRCSRSRRGRAGPRNNVVFGSCGRSRRRAPYLELRLVTRGGVAKTNGFDCTGSEHVDDFRVPPEVDLRVGERAVLHDLRRAQLVAPVDDRDRGRELGEEDRLLERGVTATDDRDRLVAEEEPVAGRARRHAVAEQPAFRRAARACGRMHRW